MDAQERAAHIVREWTDEQKQMLFEERRQAEQAARDEGYNSGYIEGHIAGVKESRVKALDEAAELCDSKHEFHAARYIRALKET